MGVFKRLVLASAALSALSALSATAMATDADRSPESVMGLYLRGDIGWSQLAWSGGADDGGWALGAGIGTHLTEQLRTDLRFDYGGSYAIGGGRDMSVTTLTGNLYFDIPTSTMFTPYVGAGLGYGWVPVDGGSDRDGLALALMAGAGFDMTDNLTLDVGYRFRDVMTSGPDASDHQLLFGLRYGF